MKALEGKCILKALCFFMAHSEICIQETSLSCEPQNLTQREKKKKKRKITFKKKKKRLLHQNHLPPHSNNNLHTEGRKIKNSCLYRSHKTHWISIYRPDQLIFSGTSALRLFRGQRNSRQLITKPLAVWLA